MAYNSTIKIKPKPCKGTGKAKGFGCGEMVLNRKHGIGSECGCLGKFIRGTAFGSNAVNKRTKIAESNIKKEQTKKHRVAKQSIKKWVNILQSDVQHIARLIDIGCSCIARGEHGLMDGGHIIGKGCNITISLNLHNIHRQLSQSNRSQTEDRKLRDGVANEYGESYYLFIKSLQKLSSLGYTNLEYMEFSKKAKKVVKRLQKEGRTFNKVERIKQRNKINQELGIYTDQYAIYIVS